MEKGVIRGSHRPITEEQENRREMVAEEVQKQLNDYPLEEQIDIIKGVIDRIRIKLIEDEQEAELHLDERRKRKDLFQEHLNV